jgi:NAD-dependent SIR2 family protein deacetylase
MLETSVQNAAVAVNSAKALLITAGAGMGVDSGLPDFRGDKGFWNAYPVYASLKLSFSDLANPQWFEKDPALAWGFYGHRLNLYRATRPHRGFDILLKWSKRMSATHVFTSNVDGHFQLAGFLQENVVEVHGSIHWMQCLRECGVGIFEAAPFTLDIDEGTFRARDPLPKCPACGALARPNIMMFGDGGWDNRRSKVSAVKLNDWLRELDEPLVIVECGAGIAVPTVRMFSQQISHLLKAPLIRINPRDVGVEPDQISLPMGSLEGLSAIDAALV